MRHVILAFTLALASGCYTVNASLPGTLRSDVKSADTEQLGTLQIEKTNWYFAWGLINEPSADFFSTEIKRQVQAKGADGVSNLTYESEYGCVDILVGGITGGCVAPRTFKVSGNLVRIKPAPLPGKSVKTVDGTPVTPAAARLASAPQSF